MILLIATLQRNAATRVRLVKYPHFPTITLITRSVVENYGRLGIFIPTIIPTIIPNMRPNIIANARRQVRTWRKLPFMVGMMVGIMVGMMLGLPKKTLL